MSSSAFELSKNLVSSSLRITLSMHCVVLPMTVASIPFSIRAFVSAFESSVTIKSAPSPLNE